MQAQCLDAYRGQVLLIVNVASRCGFTPQYADLEALYRKHRAQGFAVLGFPCDQFAHQEPGNEEEIKSFCKLNYDVTFPLFAKIKVNGSSTHPLYRYLEILPARSSVHKGDQVELHEVPHRPPRNGGSPLCA